MSPESVLAAVTGEPLTATGVFLRHAKLKPRRNLTRRQRRQRREVAANLERLAEQGQIQRGIGSSEQYGSPVYWR